MIECKVNKSKCISCGFCVAIAPKFFKLDKDGKSVFIGNVKDLKEEDEALIKEAAENCPTNAIEIK